MKNSSFKKGKKNFSRYLKFACDIETSSEYHIENKPSAKNNQEEYQKWYETVLNCKAWIYLYCALEHGRYILSIKFNDFLNKIIERTKTRVKSHKINLFFHNLKYDGSFLLYELYLLNYKFVSSKELSKDKRNCSALIDDKKNIYCIKFWYQKFFFKIQCSYLISRISIANILYGNNVKEINIKHLPNIKYEKLEDVPHETIEYIKQDCFAITLIWEMIRQIKNDSYHVKNKLSIGSWGKESAYLAFHKSKWYKENKKELKKYQWNFQKDEKLFRKLRESYHGGLTGLNKNFIKDNWIDIQGNIKTYDINSAYPFVMLKDIPYMKPSIKPNEKPSLWKISIVSIKEVNVFETLWLTTLYKDKNQRIFLIWDFEFELLKKLLLMEYYVIKKWYFHWCPFYAPFIEKMNTLKEKYSKEISCAENEEKKTFYRLLRGSVKLLMNSPYGKEAQRECKNIVIDKNYVWRAEPIESEKVNYTNIAGASFITAKTRSMILELLVKFPYNIMYWDTDCVHVLFDENLSEETFRKSINVDDFKLGNWKFEHQCENAKYLKKKCYALLDAEGKFKYRTAGYSFTNETFDWNQFFRGNEIHDISLYSYRNNKEQIILTKINKKL